MANTHFLATHPIQIILHRTNFRLTYPTTQYITYKNTLRKYPVNIYPFLYIFLTHCSYIYNIYFTIPPPLQPLQDHQHRWTVLDHCRGVALNHDCSNSPPTTGLCCHHIILPHSMRASLPVCCCSLRIRSRFFSLCVCCVVFCVWYDVSLWKA